MADTPTISDFRNQISQEVARPTVSEFRSQIEKENATTASGIWENSIDNITQPVKDFFSGLQGPLTHKFDGPIADAVFDQGPLGRIMKAAGQGAADEYGAAKGAYSQLMYESMKPEDVENDKNIVKSGNFSWLRPIAYNLLAKVAAVSAPVMAGFSGFSAGVQELGEELPRFLGEPLELAMGALPALHGAFPEASPLARSAEDVGTRRPPDMRVAKPSDFQVTSRGEAHIDPARMSTPLDAPQVMNDARARGVIGEGEAGFFKVGEPSEENLKAREAAANDSGQLLLTHDKALELEYKPEDYLPTREELAREIDPDAFHEWDNLKSFQETLRQSLKDLTEGRTEKWEAEEAAILDRVSGDVSKLPVEDQKRLSYVSSMIDGLKSFDSEEMTQTREDIMTADERLRDLGPRLLEARQKVESLINNAGQEGDWYRDYIQAKAFDKAMARSGLPDAIEAAYNRSTELIRDKGYTSTLKAKKPISEAPRASERPLNASQVQRPSEAGPGPAPTRPGEGLNQTGPAREQNGVPGQPGGSATTASFESPKEVGLGGGTKTTGSARLLQEELLAKGILDQPLPKLPEFEGANMLEQANRVSRFILKHFEEAKKVIRGEAEVPEGIHTASLYAGLKEIASRTGDLDLARDLLTSPFHTELSKAGQTLRLGQDILDSDPIRLIETVEKNRGKSDPRVAKALKGQIEDIQASVNRATNDFKEDWNSFLKQIMCEE